MSDLDRDAERWHKLVALIQASYDGRDCDEEGFRLVARTLSGCGRHRTVEAAIVFSDVRDEPVDLGTALDAVPWP